MTRRSERELEQALDVLAAESNWATVQDDILLGLKLANGGELTSQEERLTANPERHLSEDAKQGWAEYVESLPEESKKRVWPPEEDQDGDRE